MCPPTDTPEPAPSLVTPAVKRVLDWHIEHDKPVGSAPDSDGLTPTEHSSAKEQGKSEPDAPEQSDLP